MITTDDFVNIVVRRDAIKRPYYLKMMISKGLIESDKYDDNLVCFFGGMEPEDISSSIERVEKGLGVKLYESQSNGKVSKDGVIIAEPFGPRGKCNWLKRDAPYQYSFIPESEREPISTDIDSNSVFQKR